MTEEQRILKNKAIKEAMALTSIRRQNQVCRVYKCKIQSNRLNALQKEQLQMMFVEAKWLYNHILNWCNESDENKPWDFKMPKSIIHYDKDGNKLEDELKFIHSQMKQEVQKKICSAIRGLASLKRKGYKVGRLKFLTDYKQLHIKQVNNLSFCKGSKYVKIPGVKGKVRVNGLNQFCSIPGIEIACFDILNTAAGYYICFCTYQNKESIKTRKHNNKTIGIDFGCSTSFTTSEGEKYDVKVKETDRLKQLQKQLSKKKGFKKGEKKSNNFRRHVRKIQKEYLHMTNIKNDKANKLVNELTQNGMVVIQDEQISKWHRKKKNSKMQTSKSVQHSILGKTKAKLINCPNVVILSKWLPTTKLCTRCGARVDMPLSKRTFECPICGFKEDRDIHAANNMVWMHEHKVGVGRTKLTRVEMERQINAALCLSLEVLSQKHEGVTL